MLTRNGLYPLCDYHPQNYPTGGNQAGRRIRGQWDGQPRRAPKAGEWYLSGAEIECYKAKHDLDTPYHIANLVLVELVPATLRVIGTVKP